MLRNHASSSFRGVIRENKPSFFTLGSELLHQFLLGPILESNQLHLKFIQHSSVEPLGHVVQAAGFAPTTQLHKDSTLILTSEQVTYPIRSLITVVKCLYASSSFRSVSYSIQPCSALAYRFCGSLTIKQILNQLDRFLLLHLQLSAFQCRLISASRSLCLASDNFSHLSGLMVLVVGFEPTHGGL